MRRWAAGAAAALAAGGLGCGDGTAPAGAGALSGPEPRVSILSPDSGQEFPEGIEVVVEALAVDPQSPEIRVEFLLGSDRDGGIAYGVAAEGGAIEVRAPSLSVGEHRLELKARDRDGWVGVATVDVRVRAAAAPVVVLDPAAAWYPADLPVVLAGGVADGDEAPGVVWVEAQGVGPPVAVEAGEEGRFRIVLEGLPLGRTTVTARTTDADGLAAEDAVAVEVVDCPDGDGDGTRTCEGDCDDADPGIGPTGWPQPGDGVDQDCDGGDEPPLDLAAGALELRGPEPGSDFGASVVVLPDLDADGLPELAVGAPLASPGGAAGAGEVLVYGGADLVTAAGGGETPEPRARVRGERYGDATGARLAATADVDGDGRAELMVASPGGAATLGTVRILTGSALALGGEREIRDVTRGTITGTWPEDLLGAEILWGADLDGDGMDEVAASAEISPQTPGEFDFPFGRHVTTGVLIFRGADLAAGGELGPGDALSVGSEAETGEEIAAAAPVGDLDGDGISEVAVGIPEAGPEDQGEVYVLSGAAVGEGTSLKRGVALAVLVGAWPGATAGTDLGAVGDLDGDGRAEFLVGARSIQGGAGRPGAAYVVSGARVAAGGLLSLEDVSVARLDGEAWPDDTGALPPRAPDCDGDGVPDALVGSPSHSVGADSRGRVQLVTGWRLGEGGAIPLAAPSAWAEGVDEVDRWGGAWTLDVGDLDGDGLDDVVVACPTCGPGYDEGGETLYVLWSPWR